jgi:hypothetical protein
MAADIQHDKGRGFQALARFFDGGVRNRGMRYVGRGAISILESTQALLAAKVQGRNRYSTAFARAGEGIRYGCSCPYFTDNKKLCKHLFALALEQSRSALVNNGWTCRWLSPDAGILTGMVDDDEPEYFEDVEDSEDFDDGSMSVVGIGFGPRNGSWRDLAAHVAAEQAGREKAKQELLYFLEPSLARGGTRVVVGQRRVGAEPEAFNALDRLDADTLAHDLDRELCVPLQAALATQFGPYRSATASAVLLTPAMAPDVLDRLARTGRCYVVPMDLRHDRDREWFFFSAGQQASPKAKERLGYDFRRLLAWPLLSRNEGEEYRLSLKLLEPRRKARSKTKRIFDIEPQLFRGSERRAPLGVRYVHRDGSMIIGTELVRCARSDAGWLGAIAAQGSFGQVAEADLAEFVERVSGQHGVSTLSLPDDYDCSEEPPTLRPVLDLDAPNGKKLKAHVAFDYAGRRIPADQKSTLVLANRKAWKRRRDAEQEALAALAHLGFTGELLGNARQPRAGTVTIEERALAAALRELLAAGWLVHAEGKRYRAASSFDIEVESGIDWFEVKGGVTFDGGELPFPRLLAAIKQRRSVVQLGDGTFGVLPEEWMQRWGLFAELAGPAAEGLRVSSRQIGLLQALLVALPEQDAGARGLRTLRRKLAEFHAVKPVRAARGFRGALRPYQEQGLGWLATLGELGFGACLADDMGLGKTIQVLAYLHSQRQKRSRGHKPSLVVVPRSLLSNWLDEAARFAPQLSVRQHWGAERRRTKESLGDADIVLTTYGTLRSDIALFGDVDFTCVVLDEAQAIKNKQSSTAKCAKLLRADRRIAMSGTPVENHLGELWSLFEFLNPGLLKELPALQRALGATKPSDEVLGLVRTLVRPFVLRRTKREVAKELPDRVEQTLYVELEQDERQLYDELLLHYQASISKKVVEVGVERATPHLLEALLRLRQAACHPGLIDRGRQRESSAKVECLVERLSALRAEGHRALVFSQFTSLLSIVRERLTEEKIPFEYLDGNTRDRAGAVERFQSDPSIGAFLISLKAGGVGLNLTGADYVFILDPWWNPAAEAQAIDRAHRIGQTRNVIAYRLLAKGTVEERVAHLQAQKRDLVAGIMGDDQALAGRLTRGDLEALLSLTVATPTRRHHPKVQRNACHSSA